MSSVLTKINFADDFVADVSFDKNKINLQNSIILKQFLKIIIRGLGLYSLLPLATEHFIFKTASHQVLRFLRQNICINV